jgi:hypothetical protein
MTRVMISRISNNFRNKRNWHPMAEKYIFLFWKSVKARVDPSVKNPKTLHHRSHGKFVEAGKTLNRASRAK